MTRTSGWAVRDGPKGRRWGEVHRFKRDALLELLNTRQTMAELAKRGALRPDDPAPETLQVYRTKGKALP